MNVKEVAEFFNKLLKVDDFAADSSNNGLQICGDETRVCRKIAFAVDASLASIRQAVENGADMLVVHHGLSWGGEPRRWNGCTGRRFAEMFKNDLSLYAVHLPLDAHSIYGNNAVLAAQMKLQDLEPFFPYHGMHIGFIGNVPGGINAFHAAGMASFGKEMKMYMSPSRDTMVKRIAVVSGGGGMESLECAVEAGADMLVTGEFGHSMYHLVKENGVHVAALGHYNSEVHGVKSLQKTAENELKMQTVFLDIPTGL